jgi:hypothetical protein
MWYRGDVPREVLSPGGPPGRLVQSFPGNFYSWLCCPRWTSIFSHNSTLVVNSSDYKPRLPPPDSESPQPQTDCDKNGGAGGRRRRRTRFGFVSVDQGHAEGEKNYTSAGEVNHQEVDTKETSPECPKRAAVACLKRDVTSQPATIPFDDASRFAAVFWQSRFGRFFFGLFPNRRGLFGNWRRGQHGVDAGQHQSVRRRSTCFRRKLKFEGPTSVWQPFGPNEGKACGFCGA